MSAIVVAVALLLVLVAVYQRSISPVAYGPASVDFSIRLSGGYELTRSSAQRVTVHPVGCYDPALWPVIPAKVEAIAWDRRHVLAMQRPAKYVGADRVPPAELRFWILDVEGRKLKGPLTSMEFEARRSALGVSDRLTLEPVRRPRALFGW